MDGLHYFGITAVKFNHDVVQLPLWGLAGYALHAGLRHGRLGHWVLLGLVSGSRCGQNISLPCWCCHLPCSCCSIPTPAGRSARPGPWIAATVALIVMAPHLVWLVQNDFLPFAYADMRAAPARGLADHVLRPLVFAVANRSSCCRPC